jgi:hypothetical protein
MFSTSTQGSDVLSLHLRKVRRPPDTKKETARKETARNMKRVQRCAAVRTSFPIPIHNFATPVAAEERHVEWHPLVRIVNQARWELQRMQYSLFNQKTGQIEVDELVDMKHYILSTLVELKKELACLQCYESPDGRDGEGTLFPHCRDALITIGAGFFLCGLYLIMLGSNRADDNQATAAAYHLRKGFFQKHNDVCRSCGHRNCDATDCWILNSDDEEEENSVGSSF